MLGSLLEDAKKTQAVVEEEKEKILNHIQENNIDPEEEYRRKRAERLRAEEETKRTGENKPSPQSSSQEPTRIPEPQKETPPESPAPKSDNHDNVKWFSELDKNSGLIAGGKGANLGEIYNAKVPVPPGFVVTAQAYDYFIRESGLQQKIDQLLEGINYEDTRQLNEITGTIRELIKKATFPEDLRSEILEAYETLSSGGIEPEKSDLADIISKTHEPVFVAVRSSATTEDLAEASFAGQQDSYVNVKGDQDLLLKVKSCFASLFNARATYYRHKQGFKHSEASLAAVVQKMVDSDKSGVIFSKDPAYKSDNTIMEAVWGLGEGIVSGAITPDKYVISPEGEILDRKVSNKKIAFTRNSSGETIKVQLSPQRSAHEVLTDFEVKKLARIARSLEEHYGKPQDIEFAIEGDEVAIVQTRPITTIGKRLEVADDSRQKISGEPILEGLAASPGIAVGTVKIIHDLAELDKIKGGDILVTGMTNPDMVVAMQRSSGIITDEGGLTAHAAIVSREMGIPCIVGTDTATQTLKEGMIVTLDGYEGKIYEGKVAEAKAKEVQKVTAQTKTSIKVLVDLPSTAERAAKTGLKKVGLTRMEGIIAESGKHPYYFLNKGQIEDYEQVIYDGVSKIGEHFEEIWVRTSDIRSDEYENLEGAPEDDEANPMLGMHGIRFGITHKPILKAELNALKRVQQRKGTQIGLLLPQVILVEEVQEVKKILQEIGFTDAQVGVMIETPAAVQLIKDLCDEGIDFISFGTNDLTQYILAIDRGNEKVQHLYNEMHPAVTSQMAFVLRVCQRNNVETSICGQAGSKKPMVEFLVKNGINSISVNADVAKEISDFVYELETGKKPHEITEQELEEEVAKDELELEELEEEKERSAGPEFAEEEEIREAEERIKKIQEEIAELTRKKESLQSNVE